MNNPPLRPGHRLQRNFPAALRDLIRHAHRHLAQLPFAAGAITLDIDLDRDPVAVFATNDQAGNILERVQRFRLPPDQVG